MTTDLEEATIHCPNCGTEAPAGQKFCRACELSLERFTQLLVELLPDTEDENAARARRQLRQFERAAKVVVMTFGVGTVFLFVWMGVTVMIELGNISQVIILLGIAAGIIAATNGHRPKLLKLLRDPSITIIIVEHRDRLVRFGYEYLEAALTAQGRRLIVIDDQEVKDDLVRDLIEVLTSFCARLYGQRAARNKAQKALKAIESEE